ncbi:MAG: carbon-nitrogen hydrolase family protein [Planctomycetota bacterium]|nr:carbon-nitrogen hydrolase family protein [Planctomycetota bacterium]
MHAPDRYARVVSISKEGLNTDSRAEAVQSFLERLDQAASFRPDLACLPENTPGREPEEVPGPSTEAFAAWAKAHRCWVICPLIARENGVLYNTSVLFDREGRIVWRYRKQHPTEPEIERGILPGPRHPGVFKTDFGNLGMAICFDVNWFEDWTNLKEAGADLAVFSSAYSANLVLAAHALRNEMYIVSSTRSRLCRIYDITGTELDHSGAYRGWAQYNLNLDKRLFEIDFHMKKIRALEQKYGDRVELTWFHDEDWFTLASRDPELSTAALIEEFELVPRRPYHKRCEDAQNRARPSRERAGAVS